MGGADAWSNGIPTTTAILSPWGLAIDPAGNILIGDRLTDRVRKISTSGIINTIAGLYTSFSGDGGPATAAGLADPAGVALDDSGNVYIYDNNNLRVRKINAAGIISTFAGTGSVGFSGDGGLATAAQLNHGISLFVDNQRNLILADNNNLRIRKISLSTNIITTVAGGGTGGLGDGGPATAAKLNLPIGVAVAMNGNIYIADKINNRIRLVKSTVGVDEIYNKAELAIYPNPNNGIFTLKIITADKSSTAIAVTRLDGTCIKNMNTVTDKPISVSLDVPPGCYLVTTDISGSKYYQLIFVN